MNINDVSSKVAVEGPNSKPKSASARPSPPPSSTVSDSFRPEHMERYMQALGKEPDIRPEVLERAKQIVEDPGYPNESILLRVADELMPPTRR